MHLDHIVVQRRGGERVVTTQGRRFYEEAPQTQWIVHVPIIPLRIYRDDYGTVQNTTSR